jgi:hypothetical protein
MRSEPDLRVMSHRSRDSAWAPEIKGVQQGAMTFREISLALQHNSKIIEKVFTHVKKAEQPFSSQDSVLIPSRSFL